MLRVPVRGSVHRWSNLNYVCSIHFHDYLIILYSSRSTNTIYFLHSTTIPSSFIYPPATNSGAGSQHPSVALILAARSLRRLITPCAPVGRREDEMEH